MNETTTSSPFPPAPTPLTLATKKKLISAYRKVSGRYQFLRTDELIKKVKENLQIDINAIGEEDGQRIIQQIWQSIRKQGIFPEGKLS